MCRTPGGHRKIPDFILLLPPYETIFALLPFPYSAPYSCAVSVSVFCSLPYFWRTHHFHDTFPLLLRGLSPLMMSDSLLVLSIFSWTCMTRTTTHLRVIPNASQGDAHYNAHLLTCITTHLLKSQTTHLVSSNGHSGELFVFPYGWLSKDFEEGGWAL